MVIFHEPHPEWYLSRCFPLTRRKTDTGNSLQCSLSGVQSSWLYRFSKCRNSESYKRANVSFRILSRSRSTVTSLQSISNLNCRQFCVLKTVSLKFTIRSQKSKLLHVSPRFSVYCQFLRIHLPSGTFDEHFGYKSL